MASHRAIAAVSQAVISLLESQYVPEEFDNHQLEFRVYVAKDFLNPMKAGVSLYLYRIYANGVHRTPAGRIGPNGRRQRTQLPVDLHFLLTAWADDATLQHAIAGWMMRVLEDTPSLPPGLLNRKLPNGILAARPDIFHPDESVEVGLTELTTEELFRIWEVTVTRGYQISVPYVARNVKIESDQTFNEGAPVQERGFDARQLDSIGVRRS